MVELSNDSKPGPDHLLDIIRIQTEIAKLGLDLGGVMALVAQRAQSLTNASGAVVELAEGDEMIYRAAAGIAESLLGLRLKRKGSLSGHCVEVGHPLRCDDSETDERVDREACRRVGLRSMIVVPLKHSDAVVGVLKVLAPVPGAFRETDIQLLELMSELIAASMFHAVKYEANELFHRATHDALTGLANRALFFDRLRQRIVQAQRNSERFGILNLDMDGLKQINDQFGHRAGDAAIKELAARIKDASRQADTAARIGGDEFGVILFRVDNREGAELASHRFSQRIASPFLFEQRALALNASIGLVVFPDDGTEMDALLEKADQSMYEVKRRRKERN